MERAAKPLGRTMLFLLWGPGLWAMHLGALYGAQSALCAWEANRPMLGTDLVTVLVVAATVLLAGFAGVGMAVARPAYRRIVGDGEGEADALLVFAMRLLALLSLAGMLWLGGTALVLPSCAALR